MRLTDTAGLREAAQEAEKEGISRAKAAMDDADLLLIVLDRSAPCTAEDIAFLKSTKGRRRLVLWNKSDLTPVMAREDLSDALLPEETPLAVSARTGEGLAELLSRLKALSAPTTLDSVYVTNARHIDALERARAHLMDAQQAPDGDCAATDTRAALLCLGEITGNAADEAVIQRIFERFCVGK
jgi:tRNA modification GTPase